MPPEPSLFSIINLETIIEKEAAPEPPLKRASEPQALKTEALLAEDFVEEAAELEEAASTPPPPPEPPKESERAREAQVTLQKNYLYIQRRIQNALVYPAEARRTGVGGEAEADFIICTDGSVRALKISLSSGHSLLDTAALDAVRRAAPFRPPAFELRIVIPVRFSLR
jgi:protein TonB